MMTRINLLPPEFNARREAARQAKTLGFIFGGLVAAIALGWLALTFQLHSQQDRQSAAEHQAALIRTKVNSLQEFGLMETTVKTKTSTLELAMNNDVGWSKLLRDISRVMPDNSWLTAFVGTAQPSAAVAPVSPNSASAACAPAAPTGTAVQTSAVTPSGPPKLGTLTFTAVTFDFPGVAKWLTTLEQQLPTVQNLFVPAAAKAQLGGRDVINYTGTADLSVTARSGRYQNQGQK